MSLTIERKEMVDGHEKDLALSVVHDRKKRYCMLESDNISERQPGYWPLTFAATRSFETSIVKSALNYINNTFHWLLQSLEL